MKQVNATAENLDWINSTNLYDVLEAKRRSGWLALNLPEVDRLLGVPQSPTYHPEVCTFMHIRLCLQAAERMNASTPAKIAVLLHDLGKGVTPKEEWPRHIAHEHNGVPLVKEVAHRFNLDGYTAMLVERVCEWHLHAHPGYVTKAKSVLNFLSMSGLIDPRLPDSFVEDFFTACLSDFRGRLNSANAPRAHHDAMISLCHKLRSAKTLQAIEDARPNQSQYQAQLGAAHAVIEEHLMHFAQNAA